MIFAVLALPSIVMAEHKDDIPNRDGDDSGASLMSSYETALTFILAAFIGIVVVSGIICTCSAAKMRSQAKAKKALEVRIEAGGPAEKTPRNKKPHIGGEVLPNGMRPSMHSLYAMSPSNQMV